MLCVPKASKCIRQWKQDSGQKQNNKKRKKLPEWIAKMVLFQEVGESLCDNA